MEVAAATAWWRVYAWWLINTVVNRRPAIRQRTRCMTHLITLHAPAAPVEGEQCICNHANADWQEHHDDGLCCSTGHRPRARLVCGLIFGFHREACQCCCYATHGDGHVHPRQKCSLVGCKQAQVRFNLSTDCASGERVLEKVCSQSRRATVPK